MVCYMSNCVPLLLFDSFHYSILCVSVCVGEVCVCVCVCD